MTRLARWLLICLQAFMAISAVCGGLGLIITNGLGMDISLLTKTGFHSFFYPGLILAGIVGGSHIAALYLEYLAHKWQFWIAAVAAFATLIWIFGEVYLIETSHWLQLFIFSLGIIEMIIILLFRNNQTQIEVKITP